MSKPHDEKEYPLENGGPHTQTEGQRSGIKTWFREFPKSVFFIIGNELCERFSYYGMKAILSIYLKTKLGLPRKTAIDIYHGFSSLCYFTPIFGALIADMLLGKFKTIVSISMIYIVGHLLKTLASIPNALPPLEFSLLGLVLIAFGTGGIKPCVAAFGGDQFKLPEQQKMLDSFFPIFYFSINLGSLISTIATPEIKKIGCFEEDTCYSFAFGVPAVLMFIATVIIIVGNSITGYTMVPPQGNMLFTVTGVITDGLVNVFRKGLSVNWLESTKQRYGDQVVEDVKTLLRILILYLPLPMFWALFDQTGSRWTFQAQRMDGRTGLVTLEPDQPQAFNAALVIVLIPIFQFIVYPLCEKIGFLVDPLQRMTVGLVLTALSFVLSGILEGEMMKTYEKIPGNDASHLLVMNTLPCNVSLQGFYGEFDPKNVPAHGELLVEVLEPNVNYQFNLSVESSCLPAFMKARSYDMELFTMNASTVSMIVSLDSLGNLKANGFIPDEPEKDDSAKARLRLVSLGGFMDENVLPTLHAKDKMLNLTTLENQNEDASILYSNYTSVKFGEYRFEFFDEDSNTNITHEFELHPGGVYTLVAYKDAVKNQIMLRQFTVSQSNTINIFWQLPIYFVITCGEILFSITGLDFSYNQAPKSMKSVIQAAWLLTVAFGNIIVIIVEEAINGESSTIGRQGEFYLFAGLMAVCTLIFFVLAKMYKPSNQDRSLENKGVENHGMSEMREH